MKAASPKRSEHGVALVMAVLIVALLAAALTDFLYRSRVDLDAALNYQDLEQAHYAAQAGIEAGTLFVTSMKPNEWADAIVSIGVPYFGAGGFIIDADKKTRTKPKEELEGQVFNDESNLTGVDFAIDYYDMPRNDPDGFNNGYLLFVQSLTGFNFFDDGDEETEDDDIDVEIRFIDESSRLNLNALYYCAGSAGCTQPNQFNRVLFFEIRQLFIEQLIRKREEEQSLFTRRERDRNEAELTDRELEEEKIDEGTIDEIMCSLLDWLDPDEVMASNESCITGAENDYYTSQDEPYKSRDGPMESVGELRLVKGVTADIYRAVAPYLTVYPQELNSDCTPRLQTVSSAAPPDEKLPCFSDKVNLHAASDAVIRAWAVGGFNPQDRDLPDWRSRDIKEVKDEVLTLINCARLPSGKREDLGCPAPKPGTQEVDQCWETNAQVKQVLEQSGVYTIQEIGNTPNVGAASNANLSCKGGGTGQQQNAGALATPSPQFRRLVGDYITIEAKGLVGISREDVVLDEEGFEETEDGDPPILPIQAQITATYHVDYTKQPPEMTLLRWTEN